MRLRDLDEGLQTGLVGGLLFVGLVIDLISPQELVVAIIYNVPIALAGVLLSRNRTLLTIALAVVANLAAGFDNAQTFGGMDDLALVNRLLSAGSFLLVGTLSLAFEHTHTEVEELEETGQDAEREHALRHFLIGLSGPLDAWEMAHKATEDLRTLLRADAVVIAALDGERFAEPRFASPSFSTLAKPGKLATWAVDSLPMTSRPVITIRSDDGITSVGRWRCEHGRDLIVVAARPARHKASELLGEALEALAPLRDRANVIATLREKAALAPEQPAEDDGQSPQDTEQEQPATEPTQVHEAI